MHNWWHLALFLLEAGRPDDALADLRRARSTTTASAGVPLEMLDASALLWRLLLDGVPTPAAVSPRSPTPGPRAPVDAPWYAFNDVHATMALAGAGRLADARAVIDRLERYVAESHGPPGTNVAMTADVGLPASRAVLAFVEDRHDDVWPSCSPSARTLQRFGGSHAQRDALQRTLLESALRAGRLELASALLSERLAAREHERLCVGPARRAGPAARRQAATGVATATATELQDRFAVAAVGWSLPV